MSMPIAGLHGVPTERARAPSTCVVRLLSVPQRQLDLSPGVEAVDELSPVVGHQDDRTTPSGIQADPDGVLAIRALEVKHICDLVGVDSLRWTCDGAEHHERNERGEYTRTWDHCLRNSDHSFKRLRCSRVGLAIERTRRTHASASSGSEWDARIRHAA